MIPYTTYTDLIIKTREAIITQSELSDQFVINAVSVRGPALNKLISNNESTSLNLNDGFIIFELLRDTESNDNTVLEDDDLDSSDVINRFRLLLKIYGNNSDSIAQKLLARFKMKSVLMNLYDQGIWVRNISFPETINEFINNTVWPRCDMEMNIVIRCKIDSITSTPYTEDFGRVIIAHKRD